MRQLEGQLVRKQLEGNVRGNWHRGSMDAYRSQIRIKLIEEAEVHAIQTPPAPRMCFECGQPRHFQWECPQCKRYYNANLIEFGRFEDNPEQYQEKLTE
jgi:hypothetical protein